MNQAFIAHLQQNNIEGSKKAGSYIRALELLSDFLGRSNPLFPNGVDFWTLTTPAEIRSIYEYAIQNQKNPRGIFLASGMPPSYGRDGYYSAALKAYSEFLADSAADSKASKGVEVPRLPAVWIDALDQIEKTSSKDKPYYKPLAVVAMLRRAAARTDGRVPFLDYEAEWDALEATLVEDRSGKAYMPFFHVAAGQHIWRLVDHGKQQPLDRESRPKSRAKYANGSFYAILDDDFRTILNSPAQIREIERRALAMARGERVPSVQVQKPLVPGRPPEPTSDPLELEQRVRGLLQSGAFDIPVGNRLPKRTTSQTTAYFREPAVVAYVLLEARGQCELCGVVPFLKEDGSVYLEVHHVHRLADGGPDTISNAVALCPNCHRRCHHSADKISLVETLKAKVKRLAK